MAHSSRGGCRKRHDRRPPLPSPSCGPLLTRKNQTMKKKVVLSDSVGLKAVGSGDSGAGLHATGTQGKERSSELPARNKRTVIASCRTFSRRKSRLMLGFLWCCGFLGVIFMLVLWGLLKMKKLDSPSSLMILARVNLGFGLLCVLTMFSCTAWHVWCWVRVVGRGGVFDHRERWDHRLNLSMCLSQCVNCVAYLVPNAMTFMANDGSVKFKYLFWSYYIRYTMLNTTNLIFMIRTRFSSLWMHSKSKPVRDQVDSQPSDALSWNDWSLAIPWLVYQCILVWSMVTEFQDGKLLEEIIRIGDPSNKVSDFLCTEGILVIGFVLGMIYHLLNGILVYYMSYEKFTGVLSGENRWSQTKLQYHFGNFNITYLIIAFSFTALYVFTGNDHLKFILFFFGSFPTQFLTTMQNAINCAAIAPVIQEDYSEEEIDPDRLVWMESPVARQNETVDKIDHAPRFCFETALKAQFWSWVAYDYEKERKKIQNAKQGSPQAIDLAMQMYDLTDHDYLVEEERDTHVLIAWSNQTVVVSFRGTTSRTNAVTDIKAWRISYPVKQSVCLPGIRSAVHAGFADSWRSEGLSTRVVDKVREILCGKDFDKPNSKIIITGHSLGGAMGILAAYDIAAELEEGGVLPKEQILCYTFGAPRVGNTTFASKYDSQVPNTWQVVNDRDGIPSLPPFGVLYRHVGCKVLINQYGGLVVNPTIMEFSLRTVTTIFRTFISNILDHSLNYYKKSLQKFMNKVLDAGDVPDLQEVLFKNDGVLSKAYDMGYNERTKC